RATCQADPIPVDFRLRFEIVNRPDAVPRLHSGRGIPTRIPPPLIQFGCSMVYALDFTELHSVDGQADIAIAGEPRAVVVITRLVPEADVPLFGLAMSADVKNGRRRTGRSLWQIEISGDIQTRSRLKVQFFDGELIVLDFAGDHRVKR